MDLLGKYIIDAKNDEESIERLIQYCNDYPMGQPLTGYEFDLAIPLIKEEDFISTYNGYKVGFVKGQAFVYFIYYKDTHLMRKPINPNENFLIHACNNLVLLINIKDFAEKILLFLKNKNDSLTMEDLEALINNYLILVYGSVESYVNKKEEIEKWFEKKKSKKSEG